MPHLVFECSPSLRPHLDFSVLAERLHQLLAKTLPTSLSSCKTRVLDCCASFIGKDFEAQRFLHLTIKILPGRTDEVKSAVGRQVLEILQDTLEHQSEERVSLSVEILDLSTQYFKWD